MIACASQRVRLAALPASASSDPDWLARTVLATAACDRPLAAQEESLGCHAEIAVSGHWIGRWQGGPPSQQRRSRRHALRRPKPPQTTPGAFPYFSAFRQSSARVGDSSERSV